MSFLQRGIIIVAMALVGTVFIVSSFVVDHRLRKNLIELQSLNHQKLGRIVARSLDTYFRRMQYVTEYAGFDPAFDPATTAKEDELRTKKVPLDESNRLLRKSGIQAKLERANSSAPVEDTNRTFVFSWQIFKGLPERDHDGKLIAEKRRVLARQALRNFPDLHYFFEIDPSGNIVFLEPFDTQKNISSYNYNFRDYLQSVLKNERTVLSEGYISQDVERTQIITVASPIFDQQGKIAKVIAASVSNSTLRDRVFKPLREKMALEDETIIYLVDHHGHVVASSSGAVTYFPKPKASTDDEDTGNLRSIDVLNDLTWMPDQFERGNDMTRATKSWNAATLRLSYTKIYTNWNGSEVLGTFYPVSIFTPDRKWGILIETPTRTLYNGANQLKLTLVGSAGLLVLALFFLGWLLFRQYRRVAVEIGRRHELMESVSTKVAHDLGSPVLALQMLLPSMNDLPPHLQNMLSVAISRLNEIANELSSGRLRPERSMTTTLEREQITLELIPSAIATVVTQKRLEYRDRIGVVIDYQVEAGGFGLFARISPSAFERVLSNIINNSAEAIEENGVINVTLKRRNGKAEIVISDSGIGIPADKLSKLFAKGATFGKTKGSGLGLFLAKETMESLGGSIEISSTHGEGTRVALLLPVASPPRWFCGEISFHGNSEIMIVDDDASIHDVWEERFASVCEQNPGLTIRHFNSPDELIKYEGSRNTGREGRLYLIDYEFTGSSQTGLSLIDSLGIASQSILVTSHDEEHDLRLRALGLGVRILPKTMAVLVPIVSRR